MRIGIYNFEIKQKNQVSITVKRKKQQKYTSIVLSEDCM